MKVLIVDDEHLARMRLARMIEDIDDCDVAGEAENGEQAVEMAKQLMPDVVLLDVRMPGMDGMMAAALMADMEPAPAIIFCTAYDEYALEAFDRHAAGYLLKPVKRAGLQDALQKAVTLNRAQISMIESEEAGGTKHISAKTHRGIELIPLSSVRFFQAEQKYVTVFHADGETLIDEPLKELEERLGHAFIRVHRNALVHVKSIEGLERDAEGSFRLVMRGIEAKPSVSRRHVAEIKALLTAM